MEKRPLFWPADVIPTPGWPITRWFERGPNERPTYAGHIAGMHDSQNVLEALLRVTLHPYADMANEPHQVWRHVGLAQHERLAVAHEASKFIGDLYGGWKLFLQAGDGLLSKLFGLVSLGHYPKKGDVYACRRLQFWDQFPNCHWVWAVAYERAIGYRFGVEGRLTNPDVMHDFMIQSPDWELIWEISPEVSAGTDTTAEEEQ